MKKRILALVLALALLLPLTALPAAAKDPLIPEVYTYGVVGAVQTAGLQLRDALQDAIDIATLPLGTLFSQRGFYIVLSKVVTRLIQLLLSGIESLVPTARPREDTRRYTAGDFLPGFETFASKQGKFSLGYDARSILPADFGEKPYRMGGYDFNKMATETYDDLKVRTVVIDDGTGRGAVAIASLDVIGLANADVRAIRAKLADLVEGGTLVSINVTVTHTHSAIDSLGLWGNDLLRLIPNNIASAWLPWIFKPMQGVDQTFLDTMVDQTAASIRAAAKARQKGTLYYAVKSIRDYLGDAIDPRIIEDNLYRLRFVPDSGARQTVIANFSAHPERVGMITDDNPGNVVSGDFVPYIEEAVNKAGKNFLFLQGPIGTRINANTGAATKGMQGLNRLESTQVYGREIGKILLGMQGETKVAPVLNVAHAELLVECKNPVLKAAGKMWLANSKMLIDHLTGRGYTLTEIGYLELGSLKFLLQPGETSPELLLGGSNLTAAGSVTGKNYPLPPLRESVPGLIVLDEMNDSLGYIIPDSDSTNLLLRYIDGQLTDKGSTMANLNDALLLTMSNKVASELGKAFLALVGRVR